MPSRKGRRIAITGASGQLAADLLSALAKSDLLPLNHSDLDVSDMASVERTLRAFQPQVVINTAAFHRVDDCEAEPELAFQVNAIGPGNLAVACRELSATLVHISTDYVFDGLRTEPYLEEDEPRPLNVYGVTKLAGELLARARLSRHLIVRTSALFGRVGAAAKRGNFVTKTLARARAGERLTIVDDQRTSPTYTRHLAAKIAWLIEAGELGVVHVTNAGDCSWYEFAQTFLELAGVSADLKPTTSERLAAPARRPAYSVLGHGRLRALSSDDLSTWRSALEEYLRELDVA